MIAKSYQSFLSDLAEVFSAYKDRECLALIKVKVALAVEFPSAYKKFSLAKDEEKLLVKYFIRYFEKAFSECESLGMVQVILCRLNNYTASLQLIREPFQEERIVSAWDKKVRELFRSSSEEKIEFFLAEEERMYDHNRPNLQEKRSQRTWYALGFTYARKGIFFSFLYVYEYSFSVALRAQNTYDLPRRWCTLFQVTYRVAKQKGKTEEFLRGVASHTRLLQQVASLLDPEDSLQLEVVCARLDQSLDTVRFSNCERREYKVGSRHETERNLKEIEKTFSNVGATLPVSELVKLHPFFVSLGQTHLDLWTEECSRRNFARPFTQIENELYKIHWRLVRISEEVLRILAGRIVNGEIAIDDVSLLSEDARKELGGLVERSKKNAKYGKNLDLISRISRTSAEFEKRYSQLDYSVVRDEEQINRFFHAWLEACERDLFEVSVKQQSGEEKMRCFEQIQIVSGIIREHLAYLERKSAEKARQVADSRHQEIVGAINELTREVRHGFGNLERSIRNLTDETRHQGEMTRRFIYATGEALYRKLHEIDGRVASLNLFGIPLVSITRSGTQMFLQHSS